MARPKKDKRRQITKTRLQKSASRSSYNNYKDNANTLVNAMKMIERGRSLRAVEKITKIPKSTLSEQWQKFEGMDCDSEKFLNERTGRKVLLSSAEEDAVVEYCLWQNDRGMCLDNRAVKSIIRCIHVKATESGESRQPINLLHGPSEKYMRG